MSYQAYPPPPGHQAAPPYGGYAAPPGGMTLGSAGYGGQYTPPPSQQYSQHPPPPASSPLDQFRTYYSNRLRDLTFNSRPIIQELSVTAMQQRDAGQWDLMRVIVDEIEGAVYRAHPETKLPLLYLVDSISKNVGSPFTTQLLPPVMPRMYIAAYRQVAGTTRSKMEEMISLWRTSGPNRTDLYGSGVRDQIESAIFGSSGPAPTRATVLQTVHSTLQAKQTESNVRPWDPTPRHQIGVLQQIAQLLSTTAVSPQELQDIMNQIAPMNAPAPTPPPAMPTPPQPQPPSHFAPSRPPMQLPSIPQPSPHLPPFPPSFPHDAGRPPGMPSIPTPVPMAHTPSQGSSTPLPQPLAPIPKPAAPMLGGIPANVADILRNLNTSGILSNPITPDIANASAEAKPKNGLLAYEEMILAMEVRLDSLDLNRMDALPTAHLPQLCKQCGVRFPEGEAEMQQHLDWHFRRNRKERDSAGRGAHRRWLPRGEEWVSDFATSSNEAGPSNPSAGKDTAGSQLSAEKMAAYRKKWVRVPTDAIKSKAPCPICKEVFKSEWSEDEEEWVWQNAIDINGTIYHATCRAEQMHAKKMQKMLNPDGRRSTSKSPRITPQPGELSAKAEPSSSPPSSPPAAVEAQSNVQAEASGKRKVEVDDGIGANGVKRLKPDDERLPAPEQAASQSMEVDIKPVVENMNSSVTQKDHAYPEPITAEVEAPVSNGIATNTSQEANIPALVEHDGVSATVEPLPEVEIAPAVALADAEDVQLPDAPIDTSQPPSSEAADSAQGFPGISAVSTATDAAPPQPEHPEVALEEEDEEDEALYGPSDSVA